MLLLGIFQVKILTFLQIQTTFNLIRHKNKFSNQFLSCTTFIKFPYQLTNIDIFKLTKETLT